MSDDITATGDAAENPVVRARRMVEAEVPVSRRGPGWDRHWRELEAYVEMALDWSEPQE